MKFIFTYRENEKKPTCNQLELETLGSRLILLKNSLSTDCSQVLSCRTYLLLTPPLLKMDPTNHTALECVQKPS